jgi:predicted ribosome quality control (RQC) complex YloA/Tae2 family protein
VAELAEALAAAVVEDAALLRDSDDLVLVLRTADGRRLLLLALGGRRAHVTVTRRRFAKEAFATGPHVDAVRARLQGAEVTAVVQAAGERRLELHLRSQSGAMRLCAELFGARGLWCVLDGEGRIAELSRPVQTAVRTLTRGDVYVPPPPRAVASEPEEPGRFTAPVLPAIDAWFTGRDEATDRTREREQVLRALERARKRAEAALAGLATQLEGTTTAVSLRREADLMLAYAHAVARGASEMQVPDPEHDGESLRIALDPALPVVQQAKARYDRARRLEDGAVLAAGRIAEARATAASLQELAAALATDPESFDALRPRCAELGLLPRAPRASEQKPTKARTASAAARQYVSAEGYLILVGRNNEENDRLTKQSGGNDLWLHVGSGHAGSHVVIRLPRGRTASLETLLDAGTLAVHFSKARGARACEVVYTQCKHVKKPKGAPPGRVIPSQTRALQVRLDEVRLRRLLDGAGGTG